MKLINATIRPGTVLQVLDNGDIKASAPGLFSFIDDIEKLPPIMSWNIGSNSNAFSKVKKYDEVWIMNFSDNPRQLYWFRKDNMLDNDNIPMGETNVEVLCNRDVGGDWCTIYFSDGSGWVIGKGESIIQIRPDGSILLSNHMPNRSIDINTENISIGSQGKSAHPAACGDAVEKVLLKLCLLLHTTAISAMGNPHTAAIGSTLLSGIPKLASTITEISSKHVTID
jgi:hypothetical protein